jgi:hypothetical protein
MEERCILEDHSSSVWINQGHIVFRALDVGRTLTTDQRGAGEFPRWSRGGAAGSFSNHWRA